jgi:hypothetical protein
MSKRYQILRTKPNDPTEFEVFDQETQKSLGKRGTRRATMGLVRLAEQGLIKEDTSEEVLQPVQQ